MSNFKIVCRTVNDHRFGVDLIDPASDDLAYSTPLLETQADALLDAAVWLRSWERVEQAYVAGARIE
jgi:hypothetical protein